MSINPMVLGFLSTNSFVFLIIILSSSICISGFSSNILAFGDKKAITLTLDKSSYAPLTNIHGNQLSVSVRYEVDDKSLPDEKINGLMKIYSSNGTLIHSTSFPDGFNVKKKGGVEELKTTIRDPTLEHVIANITLFMRTFFSLSQIHVCVLQLVQEDILFSIILAE